MDVVLETVWYITVLILHLIVFRRILFFLAIYRIIQAIAFGSGAKDLELVSTPLRKAGACARCC